MGSRYSNTPNNKIPLLTAVVDALAPLGILPRHSGTLWAAFASNLLKNAWDAEYVVRGLVNVCSMAHSLMVTACERDYHIVVDLGRSLVFGRNTLFLEVGIASEVARHVAYARIFQND